MKTEIISDPKPAPTVQRNQTFGTFAEALSYADKTSSELRAAGIPTFAARIWQDRFKDCRPRGIEAQLLGFSKKAVRDCARLAPGGRWTVIAETETERLNLFGDISKEETHGYQFSLWYSKYLPYAYAMMQSENGFSSFGIDYESVNSYFKTCMGYVGIGQGEVAGMDEADMDLYAEVYEESNSVRPPSLPFDEAYFPACCFVYLLQPDLFKRLRKSGSQNYNHVTEVAARLKSRRVKVNA